MFLEILISKDLIMVENQIENSLGVNWQVPQHTVKIFSQKNHDYALIIPVINEGERIKAQLKKLSGLSMPVDIVIADGGSVDGSLDFCFLAEVNVRALLTKTDYGRLGAQLRMAYSWCINEGYEGFVTIDGNGKDGLEEILHMTNKLDQGYDYVQGSRYAKGGKSENTPYDRFLANRLIHGPLISIGAGRWCTDTTNGFRAYSASYLLDPRVQPFRHIFNNYELLFYLSVRAGQLKLKSSTIPVKRIYPKGASVPTKISSFGAKFSILLQTIKVILGFYHPKD